MSGRPSRNTKLVVMAVLHEQVTRKEQCSPPLAWAGALGLYKPNGAGCPLPIGLGLAH
jgi:hypothetical protein